MKKFINSTNFWFVFSFCLALGQLQRLQLSTNVAFYLHDLLILIYLVIHFFSVKNAKNKIIEDWQKIKKKQKKIVTALFLVIIAGWLWQMWQASFSVLTLLYSGRYLAYFLFIYLAAQQAPLKKYFFFFTTLVLFLALLQYLFLPDLRFLVLSGWDEHYYRLVGTILDPAFTGLLLLLAWLYLLQWPIQSRRLHQAMQLLLLMAMLLTYSRATYLAFFLSTGGWLFLNLIWQQSKKKQWRQQLLWLAFFLLCLPLLPRAMGGEGVDLSRASTVLARVSNAQSYLGSLSPVEWLIGRGLLQPQLGSVTTPNLINHAKFPDNWLVFLITNVGLLGTLILLYCLLRELRRCWHRRDIYRLTLCLALVSHASFNNDLTQAFIILSFLAFYWPEEKLLKNETRR